MSAIIRRHRSATAAKCYPRGKVDALLTAAGSDEGQRVNETLTEDEARFIDFERSSLFLTEEHTFLES